MFSSLNVAQQAWLAAQFTAWAALLLGGFLQARPGTPRRLHIQTATRMLSSLVLAGTAWVAYAFSRGVALSIFPLLIAGGMTLGLLGDLFMARVLPAPDRTIAGMGAFGMGHILYIGAGLLVRLSLGLPAGPAGIAAWVVWLLIGAAGWYMLVMRGRRPSAFHFAALLYALLLASTAGMATGLAIRLSAFVPFALGAVLFFFSDMLIAAGLFTPRQSRLGDDLVWLTYGPGQMLIVFSAVYVQLRLPLSI
jgi:hypothetical protein